MEQINPEPIAEPPTVTMAEIDGQQVEYTKTEAEKVLDFEAFKTAEVAINYEHIKNYAFQLIQSESFLIKVDHDVEIKGHVTVYWEESKSYV